MGKMETAFLGTYIAILMAALILGPLVLLHGYREWWLVVFYAVFACATIGGIISHYSAGSRHSET